MNTRKYILFRFSSVYIYYFFLGCNVMLSTGLELDIGLLSFKREELRIKLLHMEILFVCIYRLP